MTPNNKRNIRLFLLGALLGLAAFLCLYGVSALDVTNDTFLRGGYIEQDVQQLNSMQSELNSSKGHLKNIGRLLIGRESKEVEQAKSDKGVFSRFGKLFEKIGKGFGTLSQKAMDKADKIRVTNVKESVKNELDTLKNLNHGRPVSDPSRER